jgi:poly[(R)-3-hydroxyalkanoate] polymerase subunit PhaC
LSAGAVMLVNVSTDVVAGVFSIEADDGFPLVIERLASSSDLAGPSVVLCHGFGGNRFNFDLDDRHSLARYLIREGFDVWLVELRGHGRSKAAPHMPASRRPWNMDHHVEMDLPAILQAIARLSGQQPMIWIGHSLGGTLAYCLLARRPEFERFLAGVITIGSPAHVTRPPGRFLAPATLFLLKVFGRRRTLPLRRAARIVFSDAARRCGSQTVWRRWVNPENIHPDVLARTVDAGLEDLSIATLRQWSLSLQDGNLLTADGGFDYCCGLARIAVPFLFVAGTGDRIAPVETVLSAFDCVGSADKCLRVFGKDGFEQWPDRTTKTLSGRVDYGHEDLLLGEASSLEVFPYVAEWIRHRHPWQPR